MTNIIELKQERAKHVHDAREILDLADKEKRTLTAEERSHYDNHDKEIDILAKRIEQEESRERLSLLETELGKTHDEPVKTEPAPVTGKGARGTPEYDKAFRSYLVSPREGLSAAESRALQMDEDTAGGYVVAPQQFSAQLIKDVDNETFVTRISNVLTVDKAESFGVPTLANDPADSNWTTEIATGSEDSTMSFGKRELRPHPLAKLLKVSNKLLRASAIDAESLVRERLAYKMAATLENVFMNGHGAGQPLGVFVASDDGISTGQDVSTGNSDTMVTFDGLIEAKHKLKQGYHNGAVWIFHDDGVKKIRKIKDGEGHYIWDPSVKSDLTDTILNAPVYASQYAPNTWTTTKYVGIYGNFKYYQIVFALNFTIQKLVELYAATNQVGFITRAEVDALPILENAFARVKLA